MQHEKSSIPTQRRRTQGERSDETRARVIEAAVECIALDGFPATNLGRIAERAGVTTGAIQHQFGDKSTLLLAVVELGFAGLTDRVEELGSREGSPEERVAAFARALWEGYDALYSRAGLEILLAMRSDTDFHPRALRFLAQVRGRIDRMWMGSFWDLEVDRAHHVEAQRLIFTTLNGLAIERILIPSLVDATRDLDRLTRNVIAIIRPC